MTKIQYIDNFKFQRIIILESYDDSLGIFKTDDENISSYVSVESVVSVSLHPANTFLREQLTIHFPELLL